MSDKTRIFCASFAIALIMIGAVCGFMAVDVGTDNYMPGRFGRLFEITSVADDGARFTFLGVDYLIDPALLAPVFETVTQYRGLLPSTPRLLRSATIQGLAYRDQLLEEQERVEKLAQYEIDRE